jgi:translocation and assembly module TamB
LTGRFNVSGTTASFQPRTIRGTGQGRLNVAGGTVTATNIQLDKGQWQALVDASQVQLNKFSDQLRGRFSGQLRVAGTLDSTNLADIRGAGRVRFSQGIGIIQQPLTALVGWDGEKIIVQQATAPNLRASGTDFCQS